MDQRTLRRLHATIRQDCMLLVDHVDVVIEHDDQGEITVKAPGLITQLRDAIPNGREVTVGSRSNDRPLVMSVAAFDLMERIEEELTLWRLKSNESVEKRICRVSSRIYLAHPDSAVKWSNQQAKWIQSIRDLFDPPKKMHLSAPCPHCEARTAAVWHATDREYVNVPALQVSKGPLGIVCRCMGCGTEWPESRFLLLAKAIGC